jgi:hypothetical protein
VGQELRSQAGPALAELKTQAGPALAELKSQAGPALAKVGAEVGRGLRTGAVEVRKAVGIGVGSVAIELDRHHFRPGDAVSGRVRLALTEETEAKRLVVALRASREKITYDRVGGRSEQSRHTERILDLERELEGPGTFRDGVYAFDLVIPADILDQAQIDAPGWIGDAARVVQAVTSVTRTPIRWRVHAFVDIPWRRNVKAVVDIGVS